MIEEENGQGEADDEQEETDGEVLRSIS